MVLELSSTVAYHKRSGYQHVLTKTYSWIPYSMFILKRSRRGITLVRHVRVYVWIVRKYKN